MLELIFSALGLVILILDSKTAILGATEGIDLCIKSVIPALFPMMVLSITITGNISGRSGQCMRKICQIFGIPPGSESLLLTGLIGGYPTGAKCIDEAYKSGLLDLEDARRMLGFCSNAGPAFIFGMAAELFSSSIDVWALWVIHILSALSVGLLLPRRKKHSNYSKAMSRLSFVNAIPIAIRSMAHVCGWVILFRIVLSFCDRWFLWALPETGAYLFYGLTELTNGITRLTSLHTEILRFLYCSAFLAFGSFSVLMQTASVAKNTGLGSYIPGKFIQAGFSILYSLIWIYARWGHTNMMLIFFSAMIIFGSIFYIKFRKTKITVAFPSHLVYNDNTITRKR